LGLYSVIHLGSRWKIQDRRQIKNTGNTETKHNPEKADKAKHSRTKLPWFSRLLRLTLSQETRCAHYTTLSNPHRAFDTFDTFLDGDGGIIIFTSLHIGTYINLYTAGANRRQTTREKDRL